MATLIHLSFKLYERITTIIDDAIYWKVVDSTTCISDRLSKLEFEHRLEIDHLNQVIYNLQRLVLLPPVESPMSDITTSKIYPYDASNPTDLFCLL